MKTVEYDNNEFNGRAVQVRVAQGKEPRHFMAIFGGNMVIYQGGFDSGFKTNGHDNNNGPRSDSVLLQVRGTSQDNTKAIQVDCRGASLNSNDVFVLQTPETVFVWAGKVFNLFRRKEEIKF